MPDWSELFALSAPVGELIVRGSVMFLALLVLMRVTGQREAGGLSLTDVLLIVVVAEAAAPGLHGETHSVGDALIVVVSVLFWDLAVDAVAYRWPRAARVLKGKPRVLVRDGRSERKVMRRELMTDEELASIMRLEGIDDIAEVAEARIEPNGMVSVHRRDEQGSPSAPEPPATL